MSSVFKCNVFVCLTIFGRVYARSWPCTEHLLEILRGSPLERFTENLLTLQEQSCPVQHHFDVEHSRQPTDPQSEDATSPPYSTQQVQLCHASLHCRAAPGQRDVEDFAGQLKKAISSRTALVATFQCGKALKHSKFNVVLRATLSGCNGRDWTLSRHHTIQSQIRNIMQTLCQLLQFSMTRSCSDAKKIATLVARSVQSRFFPVHNALWLRHST